MLFELKKDARERHQMGEAFIIFCSKWSRPDISNTRKDLLVSQEDRRADQNYDYRRSYEIQQCCRIHMDNPT